VRIAHLHLERYGHLTAEALDFPADRGLHVVLGANEAGKSTALEAVADGLFGFEHRTSRDFLHPSEALRVGLTLRAADGRKAAFTRRKGRRDTLLQGLGVDGAGLPVPESAIAAFLAGASRARFQQVFGLDAAGLRAGGKAILTEQGEAGAAILQAQTGVRGLRDVVQRLDEAARALHGDGRGSRRIAEAARGVKENRRLMAERALSGPDYARACAELARLEAALAANQAETQGLRADQARLERIRRTAPVRGVLAAAAAEQAALGPAPALPEGAGPQRDAALATLERAEHELARDRAQAAAAAAALGGLDGDPAVLAEAEAITALAGDRTRFAAMREDWQDQSAVAAQRREDLDRAGAALGLPERGSALQARIPDGMARTAAERLVAQQASLSGARAQAVAALEDAGAGLDLAERACAAHPPAGPAGPLRDAVEAAKREGRIDEALAEAEAAHADAAAVAAAALAGLPLWQGAAAALARSPVPPEAEVLRLAAALEAARAGLQQAAAELAAHDRALAATGAALQGAAAAGTLATAEAVAAARQARDAAWRLIRQGMEGGPPAPAGCADALERLVREADGLADRRLSDAVRVAEWERLQALAARDRLLRAGFVAAEEAARAGLAAAEDGWRAAWAPAGVAPLDPAPMRDWLRSRAAVLAAGQAAGAAGRKRDQAAARHGRVAAGLRAQLPDGAGAGVADLLQPAIRRLQALDAAAEAHGRAEAARAAAQAQRRRAERTLAGIDAELAAWRLAWADAAPRLGLPPDGPAEDATAALALWAEVEVHSREWDAAARRVGQMEDALGRHEAALAGLAARLGEAVSEGLVAQLAARLGQAQRAGAERERLEREAAALAGSVAGHGQAKARAEAALAGLRRAVGTADDAGLAAALRRAEAHAVLAATVRTRTAELHRLDDGKSAAALAEEAALVDIDALPGRLEAMAARLGALDAERVALAGERAAAGARVQAMERGGDVAGPAQAVQDGLAEIEDAAQRYVRLRLAHTLLQRGIEAYRKGQQGPLLQEAGALFAALTEGRYHRLELDEGERGEPVIFAARPDGPSCKADFLSEGTRDQLFLALRLASIGIEARSSEPLPLIADDLLVNFDDRRARAALRLLAGFGAVTQVILFTHHAHIAAMADPATASLHRLPRALEAA